MSENNRLYRARGPSGSSAFFRAVAELSYDSVIVADASGQIRYRSPSTSHLLGYEDDEVLGRHVLDFPHPQDRAKVRRALGQVGRTPRATRTIEVRLRRSDGQWAWAQARLTNRFDDPAVRGIVINTVLIGDRKTLELRQAAARLDPHFLYNVLHSIAGLIRDGKTAEAVEALARVRGLTEGSLGSADDRLVPLREEWDWIRDYLALEHLRFGAELTLDVHAVPPEIENVLVPCRLVQPLVENAVKHGLRARPGGGLLRLFAERRGGDVRIHVLEEGQPAERTQPVHGSRIGLRTLRQRLNLYFGDAADLALHVDRLSSVAVLRFPLDSSEPRIARGA